MISGDIGIQSWTIWRYWLKSWTNLLQLADLVVEVVDAALVLQAELGQQVGAQLGLKGLPGGLHGVQTGLQALQAALLRNREREASGVRPALASAAAAAEAETDLGHKGLL